MIRNRAFGQLGGSSFEESQTFYSCEITQLFDPWAATEVIYVSETANISFKCILPGMLIGNC